MKKADNMPPLVYWGLWGVRSRAVAVGFAVFSLVITLVIIPVAISIDDYFLFIIAFAPLWYWYAIRWVDKNHTWSGETNSQKGT
jgi:hypothetical protein